MNRSTMPKKVLIVEDEIFVATDIERILQDSGYAVTAIAADRAQALAAAQNAEIALVDINLRDGPTGPYIAQDLARYGVKVVYVTANPSQIEPRAENAVGYIKKPFSDQAILAAVDYAAGLVPDVESDDVTLYMN